jgi:phosphoribosyl 1,2-cyclic phosphate phosphodiesterase
VSGALKITMLGSGASSGVPVVGCGCAVCSSNDPRNKRTRVSIVVESATTRILVDASPDLRQQLLATGLTKFDAVIFTHEHADHMHGIDELRSLNWHKDGPLDAYGDARTLAEAKRRFGYAFEPPGPLTAKGAWVVPVLVPRTIEPGIGFTIGDIDIQAFVQIHGDDRDPTLGLRFGDFAYSTDVKEMPEAGFAALAGIDTWIVDCLQDQPNAAHSHLAQTLVWIERVRPRRAVLTHMNHRVDHAEWAAKLPEDVEPGYDGLILTVPAQRHMKIAQHAQETA